MNICNVFSKKMSKVASHLEVQGKGKTDNRAVVRLLQLSRMAEGMCWELSLYCDCLHPGLEWNMSTVFSSPKLFYWAAGNFQDVQMEPLEKRNQAGLQSALMQLFGPAVSRQWDEEAVRTGGWPQELV